MRRLVFISNMAAPYQVKFCHALQRYFDAEFWFHVDLEPGRPNWWRIELGEKCRVLDRVLFTRSRRYLSLDLLSELGRFDPDIVLIGGFTYPSCYLAYRWARRRGRVAVMFTEVYRGRRRIFVRKKGWFGRVVHWLYRDLDGILASGEEAALQFRDDFGFGERVFAAHYAADIDAHLAHPLRGPKSDYTYLFANRLVEMYGPLVALETFAAVLPRQPRARLLMNGVGDLRPVCERRIRSLGIGGAVDFLDGIVSWDSLSEVYRKSDVLLLPALFSAGNFTVVEAMASGMGLVVSDRVLCTGHQMVTSGVNGFLCTPAVDPFIRGVEAYIADPELLGRHGAVSKERARAWSPGETARLFDEILNHQLKPIAP